MTEKIFKMIKENEVKFVDFRFTDPRGKWQHTAQTVETDAPAAAKPEPAAPTAHWDFASGKRRPPPKQATSLPTGAADCLAGRVFVTTGVLPSLDRDQVAQIVKACGGRVTSAVSGKTTHLIAGDVLDDGRPTHTSSKYVKAQNLNVAIIDEAAFRGMLG